MLQKQSTLAPILPAIGEKRILIYRIDFSNAVGAAISSNAAATLISDLNNFYRDMSYGLMTFALAEAGSVVTETLRLSDASTVYDNNFTNLIAATRQAAIAAGYSPASFDFDIICTGTRPASIFGAFAFVGGSGLWLANGNFSLGVAGHELGHNLGLPHASFWFTGGRSSIGPGVLQEYGDLFDSMGVPGGSTSHFNARLKNVLGWIPDSDAPLVTSNGTYRITAHDHAMASGVRALRLARNDSKTYWLDFRQNFNNRYVTNGATLRWAGSEAENTLLIDTTPGTVPNPTADSPILIGRTFSDPCLDLHITPIGKAGTSPEALNVFIHRGPIPNNFPPTVTVSASSTTASMGEVVTLTATASDLNGDTLAYHWDFGDGNFGPNQPTVDYQWTANGEFVARCTVSDMKGGRASDSAYIRVGTFTTLSLSGRVLQGGAPVEGAVISSGSRFAHSDSDGTYRITRLNAGRFTLSGALDGFDLIFGRFAENPVSVTSSADGLDFVAIPTLLNSFSLISTGSVWKYLDTGLPPTSAWTTTGFDDSAWALGPAKLGYGVGDERTVVGFGGDPNNRHITTWFRHAFVVSNLSQINYLVCRLRRDDGAVVYLNSQELYRENLPLGAVTSTTTGLVNVTSTEERTFFSRSVSPDGLVLGTNTLAIEVHQFATNNADLSMDFELVALSASALAFRPALAVERVGGDARVSWRAAYSGWTLYQKLSLDPSAAEVRFAPPVSNLLHTISLPATNPAAFLFLRKPDFCSPFE
jgi:hypothetical protein